MVRAWFRNCKADPCVTVVIATTLFNLALRGWHAKTELPCGIRRCRARRGAYPRGRTGRQITELSRVAAVADAFVALVSPRPYRPGVIPYHAMETMLELSRRGFFDHRFVRALPETVSRFPLGSFVALSDDRVGRVVRSNGPAYERPVVEVLGASPHDGEPPIIDLSRADGVKVVRALAGPPRLLASSR
jgi:hypothetical protein